MAHQDTTFKLCIDAFINDVIGKKQIDKTIPVLFITSKPSDFITNNYCATLNLSQTTVHDIILTVMRSKTIVVEDTLPYIDFVAQNSHIIVYTNISRYSNSSNTITVIGSDQDIEQLIQIKRTHCVICNTQLNTLVEFKRFPIMAVSYNDINDSFYNKAIGLCPSCHCIQLIYLVDPSILYSNLYMNAAISPSWHAHHKAFANFILEQTNNTHFFEIGANIGTLYRLMKEQQPINYTVLDMYKNEHLPSDITFIQGNCETFDFTGYDNIILSHVFEHLYKPSDFVMQLQKSNVKNIFISIPNFEKLLGDCSLETIYSQHTYYCGINHINYLFSKYGYSCKTSISYTGGVDSYFIHYTLDNINTLPVPSISLAAINDIYINKVKRLADLDIAPNTYIFPSGIYGQCLYHFISQKEHICGFIDNNPKRNGQRQYGTDKTVYHPDSLQLSSESHILVCNCFYINELVACIKTRWPNTKYTIV